ncbi:MAG: hypothetical protein JAY85_11410, partial [Candidatus Thiodiazotropha weberae]|nr:hypothetical protein [Candidatus Thiodiazotropha weberae]
TLADPQSADPSASSGQLPQIGAGSTLLKGLAEKNPDQQTGVFYFLYHPAIGQRADFQLALKAVVRSSL